MSDKEDRKRLINATTEDILTSQFIKDTGSKAKVERSQLSNERTSELREVLTDIGRNLEEVGAVPRGMKYCGSLSVHVFKSELLKTAAFATLSDSSGLSYDLADAALRELTGSTHAAFGKRRKILRSGF